MTEPHLATVGGGTRARSPLPLYLLAVAMAISGCAGGIHPKPPTPPTPAPTPQPPAGPVDSDKVLRAEGQKLVDATGVSFDFRGAKDCCNSEAGEPNPKWPIGSEARFDWLKAEGNVNFLSMRVGPWRGIDQGETEFIGGGGYVEENGKANLDKWNPVLWDRVDQLLSYAAARGQWVEVGVLDGWGIKHCDPGYHPWAPGANVQGENNCPPAWNARQEAWVRKVVQVAGRHGNVTWETSNEGGLVQGWSLAWEQAIVAAIKDEEAKRGYPHHLVATNAQTNVPPADWDEFHTEGEPNHPTSKISGVNEYNPEPPMNGAKMVDNYCAARASGTYYWLWRHGMTLADWQIALHGIRAGCTAVGCPISSEQVPMIAFKGDDQHPPVCCRPGSGKQIDARDAFVDEAEAAVRAGHPEIFAPDGSIAGWPSDGGLQSAAAQPFYNYLVAFFRGRGACASAWEDSIAVGWKGDGWFEENHVLNFGPGMPISGRNAWRYTWRFP